MTTRTTELEIKLGYAEDQIDALNRTVYRQQQQIDQLRLEFQALRQHMASSAPGETRSLRDDLPPHY